MQAKWKSRLLLKAIVIIIVLSCYTVLYNIGTSIYYLVNISNSTVHVEGRTKILDEMQTIIKSFTELGENITNGIATKRLSFIKLLDVTANEMSRKCENPKSLADLFGPCGSQLNASIPIVLTISNNIGKDGGLCFFLEGMMWNDYNRVIVLGWSDANETRIPQLDATDQWFFGGRHTMAFTLLELYNVPDDQLILGTDSFDVLVQESMHSVVSKYNEMRAAYASAAMLQLSRREFGCAADADADTCNPLFYATENDCWPPSFDPLYQDYYRRLAADWSEQLRDSSPLRAPLVPMPGERTYRHLNGGGYLGPAGALRRVLRELILDKDAYAPHELAYDSLGNIFGPGGRVEQEVLWPPPAWSPLGVGRGKKWIPVKRGEMADVRVAAMPLTRNLLGPGARPGRLRKHHSAGILPAGPAGAHWWNLLWIPGSANDLPRPQRPAALNLEELHGVHHPHIIGTYQGHLVVSGSGWSTPRLLARLRGCCIHPDVRSASFAHIPLRYLRR